MHSTAETTTVGKPVGQPPTRSLSERTVTDARQVLRGEGASFRGYLAFVGPAVVASIAYMDPGNFATNIQAGATYGYGLLWVVVLANLIAMVFQALSAKLGIVTGRNLAEMCRTHFPAPVVWAMWVVSEVAAMATDLAEFVGGAIGLALLLGIPLLWGMVITGLIVYAILTFERFGFRPVELIIGSLVAAIALSYLIEVLIAPVDWKAAALHSVLPQMPDAGALLLAVGIIGATVMPHAVYLHSGLTQARIPAANEAERRQIVRISDIEVVVALGVAGLVNMAMVMMASSAFHAGHPDVAEIQTAYHTLGPLLGAAAAGVFLVSLLASGIFEFGRWNNGRPSYHARLRRVSDSDLAAAPDHHAARLCGRGTRGECHQGPRHQPGRAQHRPAVADDQLDPVHPPSGHHGSVREPPVDQHRGANGQRHRAAAQSFADPADARSRCRHRARVVAS